MYATATLYEMDHMHVEPDTDVDGLSTGKVVWSLYDILTNLF